MYNACTIQFFSLRVQAQIILMLINLPLYWSDMVVSIYGFFILPWYTVLICEAADQIAGGLFHAFFLVSVIRRFGVFVALLVSYIIAALTALWYFGFLREIHTHVLDLGSHLGIGVCVCVIATGLFLACHAVWKEFKTPNSYYTGN